MDIQLIFLSGTFGLIFGTFCFWLFHRIKLGSYKAVAKNIVDRAEIDTEIARTKSELSLKQLRMDLQIEMENSLQKERKKLQIEEQKLKEKEDKLERRITLTEKKISDNEKQELLHNKKKNQLEEERKSLLIDQDKLRLDMEKISNITSAQAKEMIINQTMASLKKEIDHLSHRMHKQAEEESEKKARSILATAINRLAVSSVSEATVVTIVLPNEEMKARIIGREGRNIRALEKVTGITVVIDDTPSTIVLSGFDPIRKQIAKLAITELILDGRIHPTRIEEAVERSSGLIQKQIVQYGQDASLQASAMNLHPELISLVGKLKFRYSYGQNVLDHSLEVSSLMGIMAAEMGLDVCRAKRIGLLHDMGKAVSHEVEGSHAMIGYNFALKYGETEQVANGIGCHHGEIEPSTLEAWLCIAADRISGSRIGARLGAVEEYIKRLKRLEEIAFEFPGIERAYAMQGGQEICVAVFPEVIDDEGVTHLARNLTKRIELELNFPGKIKVTVIREKRAVEYALPYIRKI